MVNNKPYWTQDIGTRAIWFDKVNKNWSLGHKSGLGGTGAYFFSDNNALEPQDATYWKDYIDGSWTISNGTHVDTGNPDCIS